MKKLLSSLFALVLLLGSLGAAMAEANAAFTPEELTAFDGKDGRKAYVAVEGKVYDVTGVPAWTDGQHNGAMAGTDLTEALAKAPHGVSKLEGLPVVGTLVPLELTLPELAMFDGKDGNKAYVAVDGLIYDVTGNPAWAEGTDYGALAGTDATERVKTDADGLAKLEGVNVVAKVKDFTLDELATYNGKDGKPAYVAVDGKVYDVTGIAAWTEGAHNGAMAGTDISEGIQASPHGLSKLEGLPLVGTLLK